jgi:hypothetical protein
MFYYRCLSLAMKCYYFANGKVMFIIAQTCSIQPWLMKGCVAVSTNRKLNSSSGIRRFKRKEEIYFNKFESLIE